MNIKGHFPGFKVWSKAEADIERIKTIWSECLDPPSRPVPVRDADARRRDVRAGGQPLPHLRHQAFRRFGGLRRAYLGLAAVAEWREAALTEKEEIEELEVEF